MTRFGVDRATAPDVDELVALDREVRAAFATHRIRRLARDRLRPVDHHDRPVHPDPRRARGHPRARPLRRRAAGQVRVLEFGIGFPPRAKVLRSKGETLYTLNWLPIGGFVKLEGEDGDDADDPRSFAAQRYLTKMLILVAGVAMNVLLAFVIFTGIAGSRSAARRRPVLRGGAGVAGGGGRPQPGDAIVAVDGERYQFIGRADRPRPASATRAGETVVLTIDDGDGSAATSP